MENDKSSKASSQDEVVTDADLERAANAIAVTDEPEHEPDIRPLSPDLPGSDAGDQGKTPPVVEPPVEALKEGAGEISVAPADDNAERSRLGRKVKYLEDVIGRQQAQIDSFAVKKSSEADEEFRMPETREEFESIIQRIGEKKEATRREDQTRYEASYVATTHEIGSGEDAALHNEIMTELQKPASPFNIRHSNDAASDAERNYYKAKASILSEKVREASAKKPPVNPLKGEPPKMAMGVSGASKVDAKTAPRRQLDEHALKFIKDEGLDDKFVEEALSTMKR